MEKLKTLVIIIFTGLILFACGQSNSEVPIPVTLELVDGKHQIYRGGEPYFIRGAGGTSNFEMLADVGGNSVRTWSTNNAQQILDDAHELGLTVMLGISLRHERHGFDYDDAEAVAKQKEMAREQVLKFKDHPALLAWGLGNEVDLMYENTRVWHAVEDIAAMVKELDPNHLVTTVTAGIDAEKLRLINEKVPSIDYLSINTYGGLEDLPQRLESYGYDGAYVVTEWGPTGHWEVPKTAWDVPIEQTSTEKAQVYKDRYESSIIGDPDNCLGSYVFLWGQKQETTPTWYGLFLESGHTTEVVDVMQYVWTGEYPEYRAPGIEQLLINDQTAFDNITLQAEQTYEAQLEYLIRDHESDHHIVWEFLPESTDIRAGGDREERPDPVTGLITADDGEGTIAFTAPIKPGPYRLFAYVQNDRGKAATVNVPFLVE